VTEKVAYASPVHGDLLVLMHECRASEYFPKGSTPTTKVVMGYSETRGWVLLLTSTRTSKGECPACGLVDPDTDFDVTAYTEIEGVQFCPACGDGLPEMVEVNWSGD
jgi:hypothetical protein